MDEQDRDRQDEVREVLESVRKRLGRMTVAVMLMILAVIVSTAAIFGQLVDWHGGEPLLIGSAGIGTAVLAFVLGFIAGKRA